MTATQPSLRTRLTVAITTAVVVMFTAMGWLLYKSFEADEIDQDHALLQHTAARVQAWVQEADTSEGGQRALEQRLSDLERTHPRLRISWAASANPHEQDATAPRLLREAPTQAPARTEDETGMPIDAIHLRIERTAPLPAVHVQMALPLEHRTQRLQALKHRLLGFGAVGLVLTALLSGLILHRELRRVRRLTQEAHRVGSGSRLSLAHADMELVGLVSAFNKQLDHLDLAFEQMEGFSADVAHELRSPLAILISGTQLTLVENRSVEDLREALASNLEELERLKALVNDMLFLTRADQGERAQSLERVDLAQLADTTIEYCSALFDEAGLQVHREGSASAVCNPALIRRAMVNLLSNAVRYATGERRVALRLTALPGKVRIEVFNSGQPLPPDIASRMFDRFFRDPGTETAQHEGHGLGLTIVRAVARMHGGSVFALAQADGNAIGLVLPGALATGQRRLREREDGWNLSNL